MSTATPPWQGFPLPKPCQPAGTRAAAKGTRPHGACQPGARPPVRDIFARLGIAPAPLPIDGGAAGSRATHEAPFVGRRDELRRLHAGYERSRDATLVFLVEGVSGVGKSQLVERFLEELTARGMRVPGRASFADRLAVAIESQAA